MNCNLVVYEDKSWILKKFAVEVGEQLQELGFSVEHSNTPDQYCDLNIHFDHSMIDMGVIRSYDKTVHLIMVTHVDKLRYLNKFIYLSHCDHVGFFTMSDWTKNRIVKFLYNTHRLVTILPPYNKLNLEEINDTLSFGIFSNYYEDKRKNEYLLENVFTRALDENTVKYFKLIIFGRDWEKSKLYELKSKGLAVEIIDGDFDYDMYRSTLKKVDYFVYTGHDEGSMSFLDAIFFRKKIIAIRQGFQDDMKSFIDYPFESETEFHDIIRNMMSKHIEYIEFVNNSTWNSYTRQIFQFYRDILQKKEGKRNRRLLKVINYKLFSKKAIAVLNGSIKFGEYER